MQSPDGKYYRNRFSQTSESLFRIIKSIPSKKAEPFKRWLAKVGYELVRGERMKWRHIVKENAPNTSGSSMVKRISERGSVAVLLATWFF